LTTALLAGRVYSGSWLDTTGLTAKPSRTVFWFFLGASFATFVNSKRAEQNGYTPEIQALHARVAENEHTHAIIKNARFHIARRRMGLWDQLPN
jgi:hypothetical protein